MYISTREGGSNDLYATTKVLISTPKIQIPQPNQYMRVYAMYIARAFARCSTYHIISHIY